jgi:hypothetical protein
MLQVPLTTHIANMAQLFLSYSHTDSNRVSNIALSLEVTGHHVWWDRQLTHQDFGMEIEEALRRANCAVVAWSTIARNSLWVRAEATVAWESSKLVQLSLDGTKPPLPFNMIHLLDFKDWNGRTDDAYWHHLKDAVESVLTGKVALSKSPTRTSVRLSGLEPAAAVGGACLAIVFISGGLVGMGTMGAFSPNLFGVISGGMLLTAMLSFTYMVSRIITIYLASR